MDNKVYDILIYSATMKIIQNFLLRAQVELNQQSPAVSPLKGDISLSVLMPLCNVVVSKADLLLAYVHILGHRASTY